MGCCFSTGDRRPGREDTHSTGGAPPTSPPPPPIEEETVKEVLLETPVVPKVEKGMPPGNQEWKVEAGSATAIRGRPNPPRKADEEIVSEVSEVSEMCSFSESFSNATGQEKKDDDEEGVVNQRLPPRKRRVPAGGRGRGERVQARRLTGPSPERRGQVAPLRPPAARGRPMAGQPRNMTEENRRQREPGENSRRRSRSPVGQGEGRRNGSDEKSPDTREAPQAVAPEGEAESLENPVVSLECFIFL